MKRHFNIIRHLGVLLLTIMIFAIGVFIGGDLEQMRVQSTYTQLQQQDLDFQTLSTESDYINFLLDTAQGGGNASCNQIRGSYFTSISNLDDSRSKLENYIESAQGREDEYQRLRDHYTNVQLNYWMMAERIEELCNDDMNTILYFFSQDEKVCESCSDQGVHLTYVKQLLGDDVLIFALDTDDKGTVQLLKQRYEVDSNTLPVLVINGKVYGFSTNQEIITALCEQGLEHELCKG